MSYENDVDEVRPVRLLIGDHEPVFRHGLAALARRTEDVSVAGVVNTTVGLVQAIREEVVDVAVVDAGLPEDGGIAAIRRMREEPSCPAILLLTRDENVLGAERALAEGATGVLPRLRSVEELFAAIRSLASGDMVVAPPAALIARNGGTPVHLSESDMLLLELLVAGESHANIARKLIVSESTLKRKFADLQHRLGARNRFDVVARAARSGLI